MYVSSPSKSFCAHFEGRSRPIRNYEAAGVDVDPLSGAGTAVKLPLISTIVSDIMLVDGLVLNDSRQSDFLRKHESMSGD